MSISKRITVLMAGTAAALAAAAGTAVATAPTPSVLEGRASAVGSLAQGSAEGGGFKVTTTVTPLDSGCYHTEIMDTQTPDEDSQLLTLPPVCGEGSKLTGIPKEKEYSADNLDPKFHYMRVCVIPGTDATTGADAKERCGNVVDLKA